MYNVGYMIELSLWLRIVLKVASATALEEPKYQYTYSLGLLKDDLKRFRYISMTADYLE